MQIMHYKHTQVGYVMLVTASALTLFAAAMSQQPEVPWEAVFILIATILLVFSFGSLTVEVDGTHVSLMFGWGIFRKKFALSEITSAKKVRNPWYIGWGIRVWFWTYMWVYNISGFDAVEIILKSGEIYRIGTDEPVELQRAIERHL